MDSHNYYKDQGYAIVRNVVDSKIIDSYLNCVDLAVSDSLNYVWTQDTHTYEKLSYNKDGLIELSIQNPHTYPWRKDLRNKVADIICHEKVIEALNKVTNNFSEKGAWQSMYFDKSTGTLGHQDSYYLDTEPYGGVTGIWFALEDIEMDAGPFYVIPESHKEGPFFNSNCKERYGDHDEYTAKLSKYEEQNKNKIKPMLVKKGDIVIWSSTTVHGALNAKSNKASRKSLTAHYFPIDSKLKFHDRMPKLNVPKGKNVPVMGFPSEMDATKEKIKLVLKVLLQSLFGKKPSLEMRRTK